MSLHVLANHMSSKGRNGDSMLVHMTPNEVQGLQALAMKHGGSLTINPDTGLPEANFLKSLLPIIAGLALGPAGMGIAFGGLSSAASAGLLVGGVTGLATGSLSKGLMAGLGAYGGAGLGGSLASAGTGALSAEAGGQALANAGLTGEAALTAEADQIAQRAITDKLASTAPLEKLGSGFSAITKSPEAMGQFAKANMMPLAAAAAPIAADMMVPTATKAPDAQSPGRIREKIWDGRQFIDVGNTDASVYNTSGRNFSDLYRGYQGGGIVALAEGGYTKFTNEEIGKYLTDNPNVDIAAATKQFNADPAAVNQYIAGLTSSYTDPTATKGGSGTAGIYNQLTAQGVDPNELYAATIANDPNYATQGWSQADIAEQYNLHKGAYALSDQLKGNVADKDWAKFMDANNYSVLDAARAFGLSTDEVQRRYDAAKQPVSIADARDVPGGVGGVNAVVNYNDTITQQSAIPGATSIDPVTGKVVNNLKDVTGLKNLYTTGGGSLGYTSPVPASLEDFNKTYVTDRMSGDSLAAYEYLTGKKGAAYPTKSTVGQIARPYDEAVLGYPTRTNLPYIYNKATGKMDVNPDYVAPRRDDKGNVTYSMSANDIKKALTDAPLSGQALYDWAMSNKLSAQQIADATGQSLSSVYAQFRAGSKAKADADKKKTDDDAAAANVQHESTGGSDGGEAAGGLQRSYARGGMPSYALGGLGSLGGFSDGGRLLKGPGDGVSDSIPATIGAKQQPARLADGEFVVPARIVSELGNGSTEAGARKLYAMMDRVQRARGKTTGKNKVAANSRADKYLPA